MRSTFMDRNKSNDIDHFGVGNKNGFINSDMVEREFYKEESSYHNQHRNNRIDCRFQHGILMLLVWAIMLIFGIEIAYAQDTLHVKGIVVNFLNEPVPGASVGIEGSIELPSVSNEAGEFTVVATDSHDWLNIEPSNSYKSKRINLNNRTNLKIYLTREDMPSGNDPISILYKSILKRNLVGVHSKLNMDYVDESASMSIDQYMQGNVPGMHVMNRSGDPGAGAFTLVRGIKSLHANNEPLYVIDGLPMSTFGVFQSKLEGYSYNPLLAVNPQDISHVTVITDPTFTAAYGSKASNGLVLIKTLDPSATETVIDLDFRLGYSLTPTNRIPQLSSAQHKTLVSEVLFSSKMHEEIIKKEYPNLYLSQNSDRFIDYQHETNWQDLIFNEAIFTKLNLNVKGGDEIAKYGLSFGYSNADGIIKKTGYEGYNLRFTSSLNIFRWLKMNAGVAMNYSTSSLKESAKVSQTSPIYSALAKSPMLSPYIYDDEGRKLSTLALVDELGVSNPQAVIDKFNAKNSNFDFVFSMGMDAKINKNLDFKTNFGLSYNVFKELIFMPNSGMELYYNQEAYNVSKGANNSLNSFYNNSFLMFNKSFGDHVISSNTGMNLLTNKFEYDWGIGKNAAENDEYRFLQDGISNLRDLGGVNQSWNWLSFYENINYSFLDKYLVSMSLSMDASSRVGEDAINTINIGNVPVGLFYGGGIGWRLSSEDFMSDLSWLEEFKLRLSYGKTGNDDIGESNANNYYNSVRYRETVGLYKALIPNSTLSYETVSQLNAGLDLSLWGDRFATTIDVYSSVTNDMLIYRPLEAHFGYEYRPENGGQMKNNGIDIGFYLRVIDQPHFKWDIEGSWSKIDNEVSSVSGSRIITEIAGASIISQEGSQANSFYGYVFEGVYSTTDEAQDANLVNERFLAYQAGDAKFSDLSGPEGVPDGMINDFDKTVIGSSLPEHFGGLRNTFTYRRWSLSVFLQYVAGNEIFNYVRYKNERMFGLENQSANVLNRWQYQGQQTNVPRATWEDPIGNSNFSTRWIEDGSYLKIKNVSISYTFDEEFLAFKNARFYVSASNLFTQSNYLGYDPEFGNSRMQIDQGIDYGLTPQPRQFIFGFKLGF